LVETREVPMRHIDFWFSIGSTYTYLSVMRLQKVEQEAGVRFRWRPFSVRALMQEMDNKPFIGKPVKAKYMWRDIQRRAALYGIPVNVPVDYPLQHFDLANRIAIVAQKEGWCEQYVRASYKLWFQDGIPAGEEQNLTKCLKESNQSLDRVTNLANSDLISDAYQAATSEARSLGIFGSPSFVVNGEELFWGDDRLEDAIAFQRR
jgi:2-hydroxychromene-2-carboxylate isomerase